MDKKKFLSSQESNLKLQQSFKEKEFVLTEKLSRYD